MMPIEGVEKDLFNREGHKVGAKHTKLKQYISALCDLSVIPIAIGTSRPLRLMDFHFFNILNQPKKIPIQ
ncbi:MAG TPA: hypothetical protein DF818_05140, partial [Bacteroidales bacterium]|nr:hypothetical protein [Bacteroidales bacterium]